MFKYHCNLWVDDERKPGDFGFPLTGTYWAKSYYEAIEFLSLPGFQPAVILSLDNDLEQLKEGYDLVKWIVKKSVNSDEDIWPAEIRVHSANSVALRNMRGMIERYGVDYVANPNGWIWRRKVIQTKPFLHQIPQLAERLRVQR